MEDFTVSSDDQRIILSAESLAESYASAEHQYAVLSIGQSLQEDQQLAIELAGENGVKYLYILNDGIPEQKITIDTGNHGDSEAVTAIDASNETYNLDETSVSAEVDNEKNRKLKLIEERSCGTMTEGHLMALQTEVTSGQSSSETVPQTKLGKSSKGTITHPNILVKHRPKKKLIKNEKLQKEEISMTKKLISLDEFVKETETVPRTKLGKSSKDTITHPNILVKHRPKMKLIKNEKLQKEEISMTKKLISLDEFVKETETVPRTKLGKSSKDTITHPNILVKHRPKMKLIKNEKLQKEEISMTKKLISLDEFVKETEELCKDREVNVMNEMKIMPINKDENATKNQRGEKENRLMEVDDKNDEKVLINDRFLDNNDNRRSLTGNENRNDDTQAVKDTSLENNQTCNTLQLETIDDAICKEILESIVMSGDENDDVKTDKAENKQNKRKFVYERPTTRNMTKIKINGNIKKGGKKEKKIYKCEICSKVYFQKQTLQEHLNTHDNISYSCEICNKMFNTKKKLNSHVKRHSTEQPHLCDICGKAFRIKETLENHMYNHSETAEKPFKCNVCGIAFLKKYYLIRHETCHTGEKPFSCTECHKSFRTKGDLHRHERLHGEKLGVEPFKCKTCGKCYCSESGLLRHVRAHEGEKPYSCKHCSKSFSMPGDLKCHVKTHFGGDYLPCHICGSVLTSAVGFKRHQRMHSGEKPYKCTECNNKFIDQWGLMQHQRLHQKIHQLPKADIHQLPKADIHQPAKADIHQLAKADIHQPAKADIHQSAKANIHQLAKADIIRGHKIKMLEFRKEPNNMAAVTISRT